MSARKLANWFAAGLLIAVTTGVAQAQQEFAAPYIPGDAQLFAPVDFDMDGFPIKHDRCEYYFSMDKLSWAATGERLRMGTPLVDFGSLNPYRTFNTGGDLVLLPDDTIIYVPGEVFTVGPPGLLGTIDSGPPRAKFGWGERYELGYTNGENGWELGVLWGPDVRSGATYGMNTNPNVLNPLNPGADLYGSVLINFADPLNLMMGFLDVWSVPGQGGPFTPDGFVDDIDDDGQHGPDFDIETPAYIPETRFIGSGSDFEDVVRLPTSWEFVDVRNSTETQGFELMRTHKLNNDHFMKKHQNQSLEISYGARYLRLRDEFRVTATGGVLGASFWDTQIFNNLVGPQIGLKYTLQLHRVNFDWSGRFMFAYNIQDFEQEASLGQDLIPGQYNRPLYFGPTYSVHGKQENFFSPTAEMRVQASYQITTAFALRLGYTAVFVDNISRSANQVRYELPRMGFNEGTAGKQEIFINGVNFGAEVVY